MLSPTKSQFMHKLEGLLESKTTEVRDEEAMIIDENAVIQMLPIPLTEKVVFKDMADQFMGYILGNANTHVPEIHLVFDRYFSESIKAHTREKRYEQSHSQPIHINHDAASSLRVEVVGI